ncbi:unannotated protein [freshwater metagenome]|uniref:Unannotated protein n=1 Tax=freshwater metagenome TaxID=449393 RepID=A0A6J6WUY0_9ZZZZ
MVRHFPPGCELASKILTLKPALARRVAAARPPMPAPITTISPLCSLIFFYLSRKGFHESVESMML